MIRYIPLLLSAVLLSTNVATAQFRGGPVRSAPPAVRPTPSVTTTSRPTVSTPRMATATPTPSRSAVTSPRSTASPQRTTTTAASTARSASSPSRARQRAAHGNSAKSNKPQHLYGIFRTERRPNGQTGKTTLHKYGVSGGTTRSGAARESSYRALRQVRQMNQAAAAKGEPATYSTRVLRQVPSQPAGKPTAREVILRAERKVVADAKKARGTKPVGNIRP